MKMIRVKGTIKKINQDETYTLELFDRYPMYKSPQIIDNIKNIQIRKRRVR